MMIIYHSLKKIVKNKPYLFLRLFLLKLFALSKKLNFKHYKEISQYIYNYI